MTEDENLADVMFQTNDVDTMNYEVLYEPSPIINEHNHNDHEDTSISKSTPQKKKSSIHNDSNLYPISGLRIHEDAICGISTSPHQALIASVGDDYRLVLYKINAEHRLQCIRRIKKKYLPVSISFDNTGDCLAISMIDGVIEIWDVSTMKPIYTLKGHTGSVLKSIWSPSHRNTLASFSNDKTIRIWHPHSMPSTRSANIIQLTSNTQDIEWQKTTSRSTLLSSVDNKNTLRLYSSLEDYKQIYVGRSMGDKLAFGQQSLIAVNGYNLNLFDCQNLNRLNCIKTNKYHNDLINNISLQHIPYNIANVNNSQNDVYMSNGKGLFATTDKSKDNILCVWQFNDDCTNAKCIGRILNSHNKHDRKIYSLKLKQTVPSQPVPPIPTPISKEEETNGGNQDTDKSNLPIPTAFDDDTQSDDQKSNGQHSQSNNSAQNNGVIYDDLSESDEDEDDEFDNDYSDFITNLEFCKHVPQYLLSTGKDGTVKLWDCNQLTENNDNDNEDEDDIDENQDVMDDDIDNNHLVE